MIKNGVRPVHPGEILHEHFLVPLGTSANALTKALNVPAARVIDIVRERRAVSVDTPLREGGPGRHPDTDCEHMR